MINFGGLLLLLTLGMLLLDNPDAVGAVPVASDRLVVKDPAGNILPVTDANGIILPDGILFEGQEATNPPAGSNLIVFNSAPVPNDPRLVSNISVQLLEPDGVTPSDVVFSGASGRPTPDTTLVEIVLASDFGGPLGSFGTPGGGGLVETGELQDITPLLFPNFPLGTAPFTVFVQSDLEPVPEPGTLLLFGATALSLGIARLSRGRRK